MLVAALSVSSQQTGYYNGTDGKEGDELKTALHDIINDHVPYSYFSANQESSEVISTDSCVIVIICHRKEVTPILLNHHFNNTGGAVSSGKIKSFLLNLSLLACFVNLVLHNAMPESTNIFVMYGGFGVAALLLFRSIPYLYTSWSSRSR